MATPRLKREIVEAVKIAVAAEALADDLMLAGNVADVACHDAYTPTEGAANLRKLASALNAAANALDPRRGLAEATP